MVVKFRLFMVNYIKGRNDKTGGRGDMLKWLVRNIKSFMVKYPWWSTNKTGGLNNERNKNL